MIDYDNYEQTEEAEETQATDTKQSRWRSKALWAAIVGLVMAIFSAFGVWQKLGIDSEAFNAIVTAIGGVLTAFGIINNPTDGGSL